MAATEKTVAGTAPGLRRDAIGLREVLFQSITDMAPGAAIAASIPAGAAGVVAGGSLPLSVVFGLPATPGGIRPAGPRDGPPRDRWPPTRPAGLHPSAGFLRGLGNYVLVGLADPAAGAASARVHHRVHDQLRIPRLPGEPVVAWSLAGAVIVLAAGLLRHPVFGPGWAPSSGCREIAVFGVPGRVPGRARGQSTTPAQVFTTHYSPTGLTGVIGGSVFTLLAFGGLRGCRRPAGRGGRGTRGARSSARCCSRRC